jgi:class 3 adenylate cyclase
VQEDLLQILRRLIALTREVAAGRYERVQELFEYTKADRNHPLIAELAESFGMMVVKVEAREFHLEQTIAQLKDKNRQLEETLRRVQLLEAVKEHLSRFVPRSVRRLIESAPETPDLEKHERDVTVMFLDIAGYTRLSEQVTVEEMNRLVEYYFSSFLDDIHRHQGDVTEMTGDGLMLLFQHPEPDRHALGAVETAVAIREKVAATNRDMADRLRPLVINIGVNSGPALVGSFRFEGLSGTRWTYTASGPAVNLAARLSGLARDGDILVGPETARRVEARFRLESLGAQRLKNVAQPVEVFRVLGREAVEG